MKLHAVVVLYSLACYGALKPIETFSDEEFFDEKAKPLPIAVSKSTGLELKAPSPHRVINPDQLPYPLLTEKVAVSVVVQSYTSSEPIVRSTGAKRSSEREVSATVDPSHLHTLIALARKSSNQKVKEIGLDLLLYKRTMDQIEKQLDTIIFHACSDKEDELAKQAIKCLSCQKYEADRFRYTSQAKMNERHSLYAWLLDHPKLPSLSERLSE